MLRGGRRGRRWIVPNHTPCRMVNAQKPSQIAKPRRRAARSSAANAWRMPSSNCRRNDSGYARSSLR
jgi:hypothetical protein